MKTIFLGQCKHNKYRFIKPTSYGSWYMLCQRLEDHIYIINESISYEKFYDTEKELNLNKDQKICIENEEMIITEKYYCVDDDAMIYKTSKVIRSIIDEESLQKAYKQREEYYKYIQESGELERQEAELNKLLDNRPWWKKLFK